MVLFTDEIDFDFTNDNCNIWKSIFAMNLMKIVTRISDHWLNDFMIVCVKK